MKRTFCKLVTKTHFRIIFNIQPLVSFFFLKVTPKSQKREGRERGCHVVPKSERREEGQANREVGIQSPSARTNYLTKVLRVGCFPPLIDKSLLSLASRGAGLRTSKPWLWLKGTPRRAPLPSSSWAVEGGEKSGCYLAGGVTSPFSSFKIFCVLLHKWVLLLSFTFTPIGLSDSKNPCIGQFGIIVLKKKNGDYFQRPHTGRAHSCDANAKTASSLVGGHAIDSSKKPWSPEVRQVAK